MSANQVDTGLKAVVATYDGFLKHPEFREIAETSLALIQQSGYSKILVDTRQTRVIQQESQQWINQEWFPKAIKAGVTHMAFLTPEDFFGKVSVESTNKSAVQSGDIVINYFTNLDSARQWLQAQ
ncbi:STAS/SEC14 domain-containing protein [Sabulibacter ruber]|uniref:STAS/SEC14 domain-containing protein n=1 Tax=Sabulibacter ruber TaxID=2811901 RepID=UPI001A970CA1|nr:STAS/SEC14 domain-containing protein [Sabulibacter ruber]